MVEIRVRAKKKPVLATTGEVAKTGVMVEHSATAKLWPLPGAG